MTSPLDPARDADEEVLLNRLAQSPVAALLEDAGFRVEGPGTAGDGELCGRYWWTLLRPCWFGPECGPDFDTRTLACGDAVRVLLADEDLDWESRSVRDHAIGTFPPSFADRMATLR